jgi:hypothetical protein
VAGVPVAQWGYLDLLRQPIGRGQVAVTFHERASDQQHRVVRRGDLPHPIRQLALPARSADEVVTGLRPGGAPAHIGEDRSPRVHKLDAVVAASHVRHMQNLRPIAQIEPANGVERVVVPGALQGVGLRGGSQGGHRIERIDGNAGELLPPRPCWTIAVSHAL